MRVFLSYFQFLGFRARWACKWNPDLKTQTTKENRVRPFLIDWIRSLIERKDAYPHGAEGRATFACGLRVYRRNDACSLEENHLNRFRETAD